MPQTLPEGAFILPLDMERIKAAQKVLLKTKAAHAEVLVKVNLHVHYDYPKHITIGVNTVTVNNKEEEDAALKSAELIPEAIPDTKPSGWGKSKKQ